MDDFSPLSSPRKPFFFSHHFTVFTLSILLLCSVAPAAPASPAANGLLRDSQQLLSLKASLPNPVPAELLDWLPGSSPCNFSNVSCKNGRVASIDLTDIPLSVDFGLISASLVSLESLETLSLKRTNLSGALSSLSRSQCGASLSSVDLAENAISGPVTDVLTFQACSSIVSLNLSMNSLDPPVREVGGKGGSGFELQVLDLSFNNLSGAYGTPFLLSSHFSGLRHLSLKGNKLAGDIPVLGFLNLSYLDLSMNNFSTGIPAFKDCSGLQHLDLSTNKFYGDVGAALSSCPNLSFLNLTNNKFTGSIPQLPGGMQYLYLQGNDLQGVIPKSLPDLCSSLVELDLSFNNFSGILPESFSSCSVLELLDLSNNSFTGELPIATLVGMSRLKHLRFSFNNFVGSLPESVSDLVSLETFDVSSNGFSGSIPSGICGNPKNSLQVLYLQNNMLTGPIPEGLRNCTNLVSLDLSFNFLTGVIPSGLGSLSQLKDLIAWLNQLHGEIPQELMHLQNLENLILDFNDLNGSIPAGLSNCTNLNWISLSNNQLTGEIPASFGQLGNLAILKLGNNSLSGSIPAELGDCRSLLWLDLNSNSLSGTIPPGLSKQAGNIAAALLTRKQYGYIKTDGTRQCHGAGNLLEFGGIRQEQLDRLSDRYPCNTSTSRFYRGITQRTFNHNGSMIFLDISHNSLGGSIPKELGSLYYLQILNLGSNNLSGPIPPELAGLKNLAILDLSYNKLAGAIPSLLSSLTFLGEMDVSNNNLSGSIPESAPFDTFPESMFANNSGLCGYPLAKCGSGSGSGSNQHEKSHRRQASLAGSVAMGLLFSLFCILGLVLVSVEMRKRKKKKEEALEAYMESGHSNSATANSNWKVNAREALSISVAAFEKPLRKLTFADLLEATNGFHNDSLIGSGGFGDVYKAVLKDGSCVAIKKLIHVSGQGDREFIAEMETIGKIKHRNLVPLLGYCKVNEERLLVYEYMKYGSLEDVLHFRRKSGIKLNWPARRKIAIGAARGLAFLHHMCIPHIIHRDMKSSNVLLDENLEARVSDFGMARHMNDAQDTHLSVSTLAGTPGYVPPEYYQSFRCSTRGDVYSYGVVLLELLTGRQPTDSADFGDNNLVGWVKQHAKMRISDVFDPVLLKEDPSLEIELLQHLKVACACLDDRYMKRPTMIQVMAMFKEIQAGSGMDSASTIATDEATVEGVEMTMSIKEGNESNHHS